MRPGRLTDDPGTGRVRIQTEPFRGEVPRDDVAAVLAARPAGAAHARRDDVRQRRRRPGRGRRCEIAARGSPLALLLAPLIAPRPPTPSSWCTPNFPAAMAPLPGGGLIYGELTTGRIWKLSKTGRRAKHPLVRIRHIESQGLQGLLGLRRRQAGPRLRRLDRNRRQDPRRQGRTRQAPRGVEPRGRRRGGQRRAPGVRQGRPPDRHGRRPRPALSSPARRGRSGRRSRASAAGSTRSTPTGRRRRRRRRSRPASSTRSAWPCTPSGDVWATDNAITPDR